MKRNSKFSILFLSLSLIAINGYSKDSPKNDDENIVCKSTKDDRCAFNDDASEKVTINNLHTVDENLATGFAIYRLGQPNEAGIKELCKLGVTEMMVLSGNAESVEKKYQAACPSLKVIYNEAQTAKVALDKKFLDFFDNWVTSAQKSGKKIAFRCTCGCHRTGRLAAYYQMKYQTISSNDANIIMHEHGKYMFLYKHLPDQVVALKDYITGRPCSTSSTYCVRESQ